MTKTYTRGKRILFIFLITGLLLAAIYFLALNPRRGVLSKFEPSMPLEQMLTKQEATSDLRYLFTHLKNRHPAWLDGSVGLTQAVEDQYQIELANLGESVSVLELWRAASRITSQLNDGHTWAKWNNPKTALYIDNFKQISDYGYPLSVNGIPTSELLANYLSLASYELPFYAEASFWKNGITSETMLIFCGINTSNGVEMTFQTESGEQSFHYEFVPLKRVVKYQVIGNDAPWVSYEIDEERDLAIFRLESCIDNEEYQMALDQFFSQVFAHSISNVVVDLRGNGGGNSRVANRFLEYIDVDTYRSWDSAIRYGWFLHENTNVIIKNQKRPETFSGNLFVLTDTFTFSAAMDFAMLIGDNNLGILVGMPSGNLPDSYGDCLFFQMPNSGLAVSVSYKKWRRIDTTQTGEPLTPDYLVPSEDALNKVYELIDN